MTDLAVTLEEVAATMLASEPGDELKVTYQNQNGEIVAFIPPWNCNTWALRLIKAMRIAARQPK